MDTIFDNLLDKTIVNLLISEDKEIIGFLFSDGSPYYYRAEAECCAEAWFENVDMPEYLIDATISNIELSHADGDCKCGLADSNNSCEEISFIKINTNKGSCTIELRVHSNGYYSAMIKILSHDNFFVKDSIFKEWR